MLPQQRYDAILQMLQKSNVIKIEALVENFQISIETARRDLNHLEKQGVIKKIYGGAMLASRDTGEPEIMERFRSYTKEKEAIGKKCAELIEDGDSILLEVGTTTLQVAKYLKQHSRLTVITNSIYVVNELLDSDITIYVIGGKLRREENSISGAVSMFELEHFHVDKAIIGAGAISVNNGVSDYNIEEALVRKKIIERSKQVIVVTDHSKFGFDALVHICPLSDIDTIITDQGLDPATATAFEETGTNLIQVSI